MGSGFSGCRRAIMTAYAVSADSRVIKGCTREGKWSMARVTFGGSRYVCRGFSHGKRAVVALTAASDDLTMINARRRPKRFGRVAGFAHVRGGKVEGRFTLCGPAVMAARAIVEYSIVIKVGAGEGVRGVA